MLTKEYSETEIAEMFYEDGMEAGREEGLREGRVAGSIEMLVSLVKDGTISIRQAAAKVGESEKTFAERLN